MSITAGLHAKKHDHLRSMLVIALCFALAYWAIGLQLQAGGRLTLWEDLRSTFSEASTYFFHPYEQAGFFALPWANVFLLPFDPLPLSISALIMTVLYFTLLAAAIHKYGGGKFALIVALSSAIAFDAMIEINIDWLIVIGLLVPRAWSAPLLMIKPQTAIGYPLAFTRREFVRAAIIGLITILIALLIWGVFPLDLLENMRRWQTNALVNIAPMNILGVPLAIAMGLALAWFAFRRRDPVYSIAAGVFFVPYIAPVSGLVAFALLCARHPRACLVISVGIWLVLIPILLRFAGG